ncbi:methyl-accepting chemotaxis protein [Desulfovibrio sp. PG-178-WT-4]|uniref:Methyl-accepting chemotaxis protein n=1 Tax=Desulfovibrio porci TaxID=2605782 RepID=A0A6L5XJL0_9BACT|nr:methyl-accepting chemotaxis protein [Desulfovibrio porci]MSS27279.1 methyl-accepting chemotaxis protein [Desulfovibrio porci]
MKLSIKLSLAMGLLLAMLCGMGIFSLIQMSRINAASTEIADNWLPSTRYAQGLNVYASNYRIQEIMHIFSTSKELMEKYEKRMNEMLTLFQDMEAKYVKVISSPEEKATYDAFLTDWKEYQKIHEQIYKLSQENRTDEARALLVGPSRETFYRASDQLIKLVKINVAGGDAASEFGDQVYENSQSLVTGVLIVALLIGIGLIFFIVRGVLRQLGKDPGALNVIARRVVDGDYNIDDGSKKIGVFGNIVAMVNALKQNIDNAKHESENAREQSARAQEAMEKAEIAGREAQAKTEAMLVAADQLEQVGSVVSSASTQLSAQIEQSDRGAAESAQRLSEAATAMNEMNATVQEVARNAGSASAASAETREKAEAGAQVVEKAVHSIEEVHQMSLDLKEDMTQLNEHAQDITRIMGVISDIADQTNLLALNAAIEAARAGEAGRGFAVVADEVRKLAEKTMASTQDVGNAIQAIQESTAKSMTGMDNAVARISEANELASQSGAALQEIVATVEVTADQVNAIATASEEQSAASEEINQSIVQVNDMSRQTAEAMAEAAKAVSDLAAQAQGLTSLIQELKQA